MKRTPQFEKGTIIDRPSMVADIFGLMWWVDPSTRAFHRVANNDDDSQAGKTDITYVTQGCGGGGNGLTAQGATEPPSTMTACDNPAPGAERMIYSVLEVDEIKAEAIDRDRIASFMQFAEAVKEDQPGLITGTARQIKAIYRALKKAGY